MSRVLVCAQSYPYPADQGGRIRYAHLLEALRKFHDVKLVLVRRARDAAGFPAPDATDVTFSPARLALNGTRNLLSRRPTQFGAFVDRRSGATIRRLAADADVFVAFEPRAGLHHRFLPARLPRLIDLPDSLVLAARAQWTGDRGFARISHGLENLMKVRLLERELVRAFDVVCVAGPRDAGWISDRYPGGDYRVIPSAVNVSPDHGLPEGRGRVLFTGDLSFAPNADAVRFLVTNVWPRLVERVPDVALVIAGHEPDPSLKRFLAETPHATAYSVPDIDPFLRATNVVVAPMRIGSGIKVKVLTAMAAGRPIVMTPLANEGIDATPEKEALIGADADALAGAIARILADDDMAARLGEAGRRLVARKFSPEAVTGSFLDAVSDAIASAGRRRSAGVEPQK